MHPADSSQSADFNSARLMDGLQCERFIIDRLQVSCPLLPEPSKARGSYSRSALSAGLSLIERGEVTLCGMLCTFVGWLACLCSGDRMISQFCNFTAVERWTPTTAQMCWVKFFQPIASHIRHARSPLSRGAWCSCTADQQHIWRDASCQLLWL